MPTRIDSAHFYGTYYGHQIPHLTKLKATLDSQNYPGRQKTNYIYLAGDSILDNKHWIKGESRIALHGYEKILDPPRSVPDIAYQMNRLLKERDSDYCVINTAVEEATIGSKIDTGLCEQDQFIRDNITSNDILFISLGGNDIALRPTMSTILNMAALVKMNSIDSINNMKQVPWGMNHFIRLFSRGINNYIQTLTCRAVPKKVIVCSLYYLDEKGSGWADRALRLLGYDTNPEKLQAIIRRMSREMKRHIMVPGVDISVLPLHRCLNGKDTTDYIQRVEPSVTGGEKMARYMLDAI